MKETQDRHTAGVYNPKKGQSQFAATNNQTRSQVGNLINYEKISEMPGDEPPKRGANQAQRVSHNPISWTGGAIDAGQQTQFKKKVTGVQAAQDNGNFIRWDWYYFLT